MQQPTNQQLLLEKLGCPWRDDKMFTLPEVWDVATARLLCELGFPAIATSASAVAWANGYRLTERVKLEDLLMLAARIFRDTKKTVIGDIEGSYERGTGNVKNAVEAALHVGCTGVILGDGSREGLNEIQPIEIVANHIKTARMTAMAKKKPLVIIARSDTFYQGRLMATPLLEAENRAKAFLDAGADVIHFPAIQNTQIIARLTKVISGPLAITLSHKGAANLEVYQKLGVAMVMLGTGLMRSALTDMQLKAASLMESGEAVHLEKAMSEAEAATLFSSAPRQKTAEL